MPLDSVRDLFSRMYEGRRDSEMSLDAYLRLCRSEPATYASAAERLLRAIGDVGDRGHRTRSSAEPHLRQPHHRPLPGVQRFLRHGGDDRADRRLPAPRLAGAGGAQADPLSARPGRRRQILARRTHQGARGTGAGLRAQGRPGHQPVAGKPARPVRQRRHARDRRAGIRGPDARDPRADEPVGGQAARRVRGRHRPLHRGADDALAAAPGGDRQDRAGRREQPGYLLPCRQGGHPPARVASRRPTRTPTAIPAG